jgi:hypothetical protein
LVFITINLYNFILCILNNFLKTKFKKILERVLPTEWIRRHLTVAATFTDEFTDGYIRLVFHTLTDNFIDRMNPSVFDSSCHNYRRIYRWISSVGISNTHWQIYRWYVFVGKSCYHRREKIRWYISSGKIFFGMQISSVKPSANGFFCVSDRYSDGMGNYRWKESRRTYFVGEDIGK